MALALSHVEGVDAAEDGARAVAVAALHKLQTSYNRRMGHTAQSHEYACAYNIIKTRSLRTYAF